MSLLLPSPIRYPGLSALIGFSRVGLDPSENIPARNWGASAHDRAEGIHRPLVADAVVFLATLGRYTLDLRTRVLWTLDDEFYDELEFSQ